MAATKVLVIYSKKQKVRRRLVICDLDHEHDGHLDHHRATMHELEDYLEIPLNEYRQMDHDALQAYIANAIGAPESDRCAVVCHKTGIVKHVVRADPEIDFHPEGRIVPHETAVVGDVHQ